MEWARYNTELININLIVKLSNKKGALHFALPRTPNSPFRVRHDPKRPNRGDLANQFAARCLIKHRADTPLLSNPIQTPMHTPRSKNAFKVTEVW